MSTSRNRWCVAVALCLSAVIVTVSAQDPTAGTTSCNDNHQANCFGSGNDPESRSGFGLGDVECDENQSTCIVVPPCDWTDCCCADLVEYCEGVFGGCVEIVEVTGDDELTTLMVDPIGAELRVHYPPSGVIRRGTIVLTSAGAGMAFFGDTIIPDGFTTEPDGMLFIGQLAALGFVVVEISWVSSWTGMTGDDVPTRLEASRYVTLLKYTWERHHCDDQDGAFVAAGISGGGSAIGYALSSYNMTKWIDVAIFMSGPANADLERACDESDPDWCDGLYSELCEFDAWSACTGCTDLKKPCVPDDTCDHPTCIFDESVNADAYEDVCLVGNCTDMDDPICRQFQSVAWDTMNCEQYDFTYCHFLIAGADGSNAALQLGPTGALAFYDRICSRKGLDIIPCTPHLMQRDIKGQEWILRTIDFYTRRMVGDVNQDGNIDCTDVALVEAEMDDPKTKEEEQCTGYDCQGDVNNDLQVTQADLDIVEDNMNSSDAYNTFEGCFATSCTTECGTVYDGCSVCTGSPSLQQPACPPIQPGPCQCPISDCDDCVDSMECGE